MLSVPESIIQQVQSKLFSFLWKNKKDKIKRKVLYLPLSIGGLKFPCFGTGTMVKALRLSWISRFLLRSDKSWKAIPNSYFNKRGIGGGGGGDRSEAWDRETMFSQLAKWSSQNVDSGVRNNKFFRLTRIDIAINLFGIVFKI